VLKILASPRGDAYVAASKARLRAANLACAQNESPWLAMTKAGAIVVLAAAYVAADPWVAPLRSSAEPQLAVASADAARQPHPRRELVAFSIDFKQSVITHNNLGGMGPNDAACGSKARQDPKELRCASPSAPCAQHGVHEPRSRAVPCACIRPSSPPAAALYMLCAPRDVSRVTTTRACIR